MYAYGSAAMSQKVAALQSLLLPSLLTKVAGTALLTTTFIINLTNAILAKHCKGRGIVVKITFSYRYKTKTIYKHQGGKRRKYTVKYAEIYNVSTEVKLRAKLD